MPGAAQDRFVGLRRQAERLAAGEITSVEAVTQSLDLAESLQPTVNAFRVLRRQQALAEAVEADRRLAAGERAPLLGAPIAIKDDTDLAGETTPFGCAGDFKEKEDDAEVVRRLRLAGAVVVGKTNTPELGLYPWTEGRAFGVTRNPWNLDHTPGGSSGGSAAAVAAGVVPAALGSDGAGSVRIPAGWSNLVGIKPQRGRISTWPDPESFNGITCFGPLARTVDDAALLLDALSGNHPGDLHRPPSPSAPYTEAARREPGALRIAVSWSAPRMFVRLALDPQVRSAVRGMAERLADLGHRVEEANVHYGLVGVPFVSRSTAGVAEWCTRVPDLSLLDARSRSAGAAGRRLGRLWSLSAVRASERPLAAQIGRIFRRFDVVLTPTAARPPLPIGSAEGLSGWTTDRLMAAACPYAWPWNFLGWPSVNVPAGFVTGGLPIGAQLMGPANSEELLISLAAQLEGVSGWAEVHPPL